MRSCLRYVFVLHRGREELANLQLTNATIYIKIILNLIAKIENLSIKNLPKFYYYIKTKSWDFFSSWVKKKKIYGNFLLGTNDSVFQWVLYQHVSQIS